MDVKLAVLAEYASVSTDGKLNLLGIFNQISSDKMPAGVPIIYIAVSFEAGPAEFGSTKRIETFLHDEDNAQLLHAEQTATVPRADRAGVRATLNVVSAVAGLGFAKAGTYQFAILVDGRTETTIPLHVVQLEGGANAAGN